MQGLIIWIDAHGVMLENYEALSSPGNVLFSLIQYYQDYKDYLYAEWSFYQLHIKEMEIVLMWASWQSLKLMIVSFSQVSQKNLPSVSIHLSNSYKAWLTCTSIKKILKISIHFYHVYIESFKIEKLVWLTGTCKRFWVLDILTVKLMNCLQHGQHK